MDKREPAIQRAARRWWSAAVFRGDHIVVRAVRSDCADSPRVYRPFPIAKARPTPPEQPDGLPAA